MIGMGVFFVGMIGMLVGSKGQRGWDLWSRRQKIICTVSFVLVIAGLALADASEGHA
ncbi:UNVERIFIED_CONTAM: hypothetical protein RKD50_004976 [Streptomyces canus]|uniref:hypothetical protein n=1 Tax=unclassified Streptomyces TaxID=2593676 RepID=UPI002472EB1F|nr:MULTISPECIES: hypothetical protein [unclassified Streptomyces]MDH6441308.1 hypothetical protein [Streptomyces sp. SAI-144]MDH6488624.1 hypothetical protein [Streptomyces sp. SAI-127]